MDKHKKIRCRYCKNEIQEDVYRWIDIVYLRHYRMLTLNEIGEIFGVSKQRISAVLKKVSRNTFFVREK